MVGIKWSPCWLRRVNVDPELIVPEARLYADLGMTNGMY